MKPGGNPALTEYSCKGFPCRTTQSRGLLEKDGYTAKYLHDMPRSVESLEFIKFYSLISPTSIKSSSNSIR